MRSIANDLRALVEVSTLTYEGHIIRETVPVGATLVRPEDTAQSLLKRRDFPNYKCKATGRNCFFPG